MSVASVFASIVRFEEHPYKLDKAGEPMVVAHAGYLPEDAEYAERLIELAGPAIEESLTPLQGLTIQQFEIPCFLGLPPLRPGWSMETVALFKELVEQFEPYGRKLVIQDYISCGHSAGLMAIQKGSLYMVESGAPFCLVGGVDSYIMPETLQWLDEEDQLLSEENRFGFIPGEAAGFCLLVAARVLQHLSDCRAIGKIFPSTTTYERHLIKSQDICTGEGLTAAIRYAAENIKVTDARIEKVYCDMNGERYRADEYGFAISRLGKHFVDPTDIMTPADCWGDIGAATGPLLLALAAGSKLVRQETEDHFSLIWTSSESGERSALIFQQV